MDLCAAPKALPLLCDVSVRSLLHQSHDLASLVAVVSGVIRVGYSSLLFLAHLAGFGALVIFSIPSLTSKRGSPADPLATWRNLVLGLTALYILTLFSTAVGKTPWFNKSPSVFVAHNSMGLALVLASGWLLMRAR